MESTAGGGTDVFGDIGRESDDVVIERAFELVTALETKRRPGLHLRQVFLGNEALGAERLGGQELNLEPDFKPPLFGPDFPHGRAGVALNHTLTLGQTLKTLKAIKALNR